MAVYPGQAREANMKLTGGKIAALLENLYMDQELWYPYNRIKDEISEVRIVGPEAASCKSA